jgi:hypothetical protein
MEREDWVRGADPGQITENGRQCREAMGSDFFAPCRSPAGARVDAAEDPAVKAGRFLLNSRELPANDSTWRWNGTP